MFSLTQKLLTVAKEYPTQIAMQAKTAQGYTTYTYQDILTKVQTVAQTLINSGVKKHDRVAIALENCPEWGIIYFGILLAGGIAVPFDPQSTTTDIEYFLENSGSKIIFASGKIVPVLHNCQLPIKIISISELINTGVKTRFIVPLGSLQEGSNENDIASIIYTSGTTGKPKGVMLTHKNLYSNYLSITKLNFLQGENNILAILPLHHTFPFMTTLLVPLFLGIKITYPHTLQSTELLRCMREAKITALVSVPQFYYLFYSNIKSQLDKTLFLKCWLFYSSLTINYWLRKLLNFNLGKIIFATIHHEFGKQLRFFVSGGAKLDVSINEFFFSLGFTIVEGYGLTETSPVVTFNPLEKIKLGSVGKAIPGVQIRISEPDSEGIGEIIIHGPNVMAGYYQLPEATQKVVRDGWFYSGDLGYLDKDSYLYIVGRKNEMIVLSNGKKVAPEELEKHYLQSSYIKEICVLAIGKEVQEKLMAVIVPNWNYFRETGEVAIYETIRWDLENFSKILPPYQHIFGFILSKEDLPRTRLGKLQRYLIKEKYAPELQSGKQAANLGKPDYTEQDIALLSSSVTKTVLKILSKESGHKEVSLYDYLEIDLGIDSLKRLELITAVEKLLQVKIPENEIIHILTVKELILAAIKLGGVIGNESEIKFTWSELLQTPPALEITGKVDLRPSKFACISTFLFDSFLYWLLRLTCHFTVIGQNNLPRNQAFILCPNHNSYLDGFIIAAACPHNLQSNLFFFGLSAFIEAPIIKHLQKLIRIIPISPVEHMVAAMQAGAYVLHNHKILGIFPEAERSFDGKIKAFKNGIGILVKELNVPIVPVYIKGSFETWPRGQRFPKPHPIKVVFGKASKPEDLKALGTSLGAKDDYTAITLGARKKLLDLEVDIA